MNPIHIDFIGNYFLAKRYARTLDDNMTYLLNNYMVYGFLSFPEDLKDRFVIEVLMIIGHNLKQKNGQKLGLQACYAFVLAQSLLINTHENLTRSQVQDIVIAAIQVIQMDKKSETVLAACFTTINAALVFCPMITIQTLLQRDFLQLSVSSQQEIGDRLPDLLRQKVVSVKLDFFATAYFRKRRTDKVEQL